MLRDNNVISDVVNIIQTDNFYLDAHQKIFHAMWTIYDKGQPVDIIILAEYLNAHKQLDDVGRAAYLAELWDAAPTAAVLTDQMGYTRQVQDGHRTRYTVAAGAGAKDPKTGLNWDVAPAKYTVEVKFPGAAAKTEVLTIAADESWGLMILPTGDSLPIQLY